MAKCPDCGSNSIFHRPGSLDCIATQMPEADRKQNKALAMEGFKKLATFIAVTVFLIWQAGFRETFLMLTGGLAGYAVGSLRFQKREHAQGFYDGWIARHQGQDGIPAHIWESTPQYCYTGITFALSKAERELLKDPEERRWRNLPPLEDGK